MGRTLEARGPFDHGPRVAAINPRRSARFVEQPTSRTIRLPLGRASDERPQAIRLKVFSPLVLRQKVPTGRSGRTPRSKMVQMVRELSPCGFDAYAMSSGSSANGHSLRTGFATQGPISVSPKRMGGRPAGTVTWRRAFFHSPSHAPEVTYVQKARRQGAWRRARMAARSNASGTLSARKSQAGKPVRACKDNAENDLRVSGTGETRQDFLAERCVWGVLG